MYTFTVDWFSHNIPSWTHIFHSLGWLKSDRVLHALEIGTWEGQSACWLLKNVCCNSASRIVCIDTWAGAQQYGAAAQDWCLSSETHEGSTVLQRFQDNLLAAGAKDRVVVLQQSSCTALAGLFSTHLNAFDIVYIDGSHYPQDVLTDAVMAWKLLNEGGIMILDDYEWHQVTRVPVEQTPKKAIDAFLHVFVEELHVLVLGYQCIVQKHTAMQGSDRMPVSESLQ